MSVNIEEYPYEVKPFTKSENEEILKYFKGERNGFVRVGPKNYVFPRFQPPAGIQSMLTKFYNLKLKSDDIFVLTFPRSGTTWTQQLVWLIAQDQDTITAKSSLGWTFIELQCILQKEVIKELKELNKNDSSIINTLEVLGNRNIDDIKERRFFKTHVPFSLLPPSLLDTAKVVYVARHPLDVAVSFYHHNRLIKFHDYVGDFKTYWKLFRKGSLLYTPYFEHLKEAYEKRDHPNMLFLYYEDMCEDLPSVTKKISKFLEKELSEERVQKLCQELSFDNFKKNPHVNISPLGKFFAVNDNGSQFIRKGKVGDWENYFDEEMKEDAMKWIEENLKGTDIKFSSK